jgi:transposase
MHNVNLHKDQINRLRAELRHSRSSNVYRRATALLAANQGTSAAKIAALLGVTRQTVYNWITSYVAHGAQVDLRDAPRSGRPSLLNKEIDAFIVGALAFSPDVFGYTARRWSAAVLRTHVGSMLPHEVSEETLRRRLRRIGYFWVDGRYVRKEESMAINTVDHRTNETEQ